jgi:hypothetical protein
MISLRREEHENGLFVEGKWITFRSDSIGKHPSQSDVATYNVCWQSLCFLESRYRGGVLSRTSVPKLTN